MTGITTHVLDTVRGGPAAAVAVRLERRGPSGQWTDVARAATDPDGRAGFAGEGSPGVYRLEFDTGAYFTSSGVDAFYPQVAVIFEIRDGSRHHHVPLLLSPFGYSTYRGS